MLVLLVEDNRHLASNIVEYLELEGVECDWADNGALGLALACEESFDLIVLDLMLPRIDGITVCQKIRQAGIFTPILMLTARDTLDDKLEGFQAGADDYLVKPFDLPELYVRLKALARRGSAQQKTLTIADLEVNLSDRSVTRAGTPIHLNRISWEILTLLIQASPAVLSRQEIENKVWRNNPPDSDSLKVHLYKLRQAVDKNFENKLIHTIRGFGVTILNKETKHEI